MKKQQKLQVFSFSDKVYCASFEVCVGEQTDMVDYMKTKYDVTLEDDIYHSDGLQFSIENKHVNQTTSRKYFLYLKNNNDPATLGHELIHLISDIFMDRGVNVDLKKDQEAFAYFFSYLFEEIWEKLKEKKKKLTKKK